MDQQHVEESVHEVHDLGLVGGADVLDGLRAGDLALAQVLHDGHVGAIDPATRFYVIWRWAYGSNDVPFDDGRVLAQALGAAQPPQAGLGRRSIRCHLDDQQSFRTGHTELTGDGGAEGLQGQAHGVGFLRR